MMYFLILFVRNNFVLDEWFQSEASTATVGPKIYIHTYIHTSSLHIQVVYSVPCVVPSLGKFTQSHPSHFGEIKCSSKFCCNWVS